MRNVLALAIGVSLSTGGIASAQTSGPGSGAAGPFTVEAEALVWWQKASPTPTPIITDGIFGRPATRVLLGGGDMDTNGNPGLRLKAAYALDRRWGLDGSFLYFDKRSTSSSVASSGAIGSTDLLLPFFDVTVNRESATEVSFAPIYAGSASVSMSNRLMGAEANATYALDSARPWDYGLIGGFRWLQLKETYTISTSSPFIPPNPSGEVWNTKDTFAATNDFYGAQLGAHARYESGGWFAKGMLKVGIGAMVQSVDVNGQLVTNDFNQFGATQSFPGGYFALPSNMGGHSRTVFAVVPELRFDAGYRITPTATVFVGYTLLYANDVARPGNHVDRNVNPTQSVSWVSGTNVQPLGPSRPSFSFNGSSFWTQGVNVGLGVQF